MALRALVVGGTSGVGFGIACRLASENSASMVTIGGRTKPQNIPHPNIDFRPLDATSMRQIKQYTDAFKSSLQSQSQTLDLLVMSQGTMTMAGRTETPEGIDSKMALHYYGKQLLIRELLPAMSDDAKVVIVYDAVYGNPDKMVWEDLGLKTHFSLSNAANHCMVMNDAMVQYFAARQKADGAEEGAHRHFVHAWPGGVNTGLWRDLPIYMKPVGWAALQVFGVSPEKCATRLLAGTTARAAAGLSQGRHWSNIDNKGNLIPKKVVFTKEQLSKIADHTWETIDQAIATPE